MKNKLRFGVYLPPFGPSGDPAVLVDLAVRAKASGWDGVFLWDRRAVDCDGILPDLAGRTPATGDVAGIAAALRRAGLPPGRPFDIAVAGNASHAWPEPHPVDLAGLIQAGMTWWLESLIHFDPLELSLAVVDAGPPRRPGRRKGW